MWSLKQLADVVERSVLNVVDGYDASTELPSGNVDIRQSMFLKYRDEDVRVASFVDWPHKNPSPKELAKHGFFHTPLPDVSDRVACCACGKILFNWTEADDIEEGHRKFSPDCPIILGIPLQLPSSVTKAQPSNLAHFVSNLQNAQQHEDDRFLTPPSSALSADSVKDVTPLLQPDATNSGVGAASSLWQFASADADHNCDNAHDVSDLVTSLKRKKSVKKSGKMGKANDIVGAHTSEDSAATIVELPNIGLSFVQASVGTEVDGNSDLARLPAFVHSDEHSIPIEAIFRLQDGIQAAFMSSLRMVSSRVDVLWQRLSSLNSKLEFVQRSQWIVDFSKRAAEAERSREQSKAASQELLSISAELEGKRASLEALRCELARCELAQREAIEIEASVAQHRQQLSDLIRKQECLQLSFASLNSQYERMDAEVASRRDELRVQISVLAEEKCSLEVALSLHHERLEAQRAELQSFTARVDRCRNKEVAAAEKEADLIKREEEVRRRELTVNAREEWMQKKEGEFRSAQRVAEHARNGAIAALAGSQFDSSPPSFQLSRGRTPLQPDASPTTSQGGSSSSSPLSARGKLVNMVRVFKEDIQKRKDESDRRSGKGGSASRIGNPFSSHSIHMKRRGKLGFIGFHCTRVPCDLHFESAINFEH